MPKTRRLAVGVVALAMVTSGCFGSFSLTRKLYNWNATISQDKWAKEFMFIVLAAVHLYSLVSLGDAIVFNSIEFWTGNNPIEPTSMKKSEVDGTRTLRIVRQDAEALLTELSGADGPEWLIEQFQDGQSAGGLHIKRHGGISVGYGDDGRVLFTAQTLPDGSVLVSNGEGQRVAFYSAQDAAQFATSVQ